MKIAMIGSTGHWNYAISGVEATADAQIVGAARGSQHEEMDAVMKACEKIGQGPRLFDDYRKLLDETKPDVVCASPRFKDHAEVACEVLNRKIALFIEKPVALTLEDLTRIRAAQSESGAAIMAMLGLRYSASILSAWQQVRQGAIGEVRLLTAQKSYRLNDRPDYYRKRDTYGGTIPWVGAHSVDLIAWFAGVPFKSVYAAHSTRANRGHGELEVTALCQFTLENEVLGSTHIDYCRPAKAPTHGDDRIRVAGSKGVVEARGGKAYLVSDDIDGERELPPAETMPIFADFLKQVKGEGEALISTEDSLKVTQAVLLARQSADEGRVVTFPE